MRESLVQSIQSSFNNGWRNLPASRKLSIGIVAAAVVAGIVGIVLWSSRPDYKVLCNELSPEGLQAVEDELRLAGVSYKQGDNGSSIMVPATEVERMRLRLVNRGIPEAGNIGFESFGKSSWGKGDFEQKLMYQNALQVELVRTIKQITQVKSARVHIVLQRSNVFLERSQPAKASVALKLNAGTKLGDEQVDGIVFLVAGAVEGLDRENVTVIDTSSGRIISTSTKNSFVDGSQLKYQQAVEAEREAAIQAIIDPVVGYGNASVQVSAEIDFKSTQTTDESYSPDGSVPRSEMTSEYTTKNSGLMGNPSGVPGITSRVTPNAQSGANSPEYNRTESTTEYELSKKIANTIEQPGKITKLSVAVVVNESVIDQAQMQKLEALVSSAGGVDAVRDDITVTSLPFDTSLQQQLADAEKADKRSRLIYTATRAAIGVAVFVFLLIVLRSLLKKRPRMDEIPALPEATGAAIAPQMGMPFEGMPLEGTPLAGVPLEGTPLEGTPLAEMPTELAQDSPVQISQTAQETQEILEILKEDPERVAQIVRSWLKE